MIRIVTVCKLVLAFGASASAAQLTLRDAARLDSENRCHESEMFYREALRKGSPAPALLNNAGNHYLSCGEPRRAKALFEHLVRINPAHSNANIQLARLALESHDGAQALRYLARVEEPSTVLDILRAEASYRAGQREPALALFRQAENGGHGDLQTLLLLSAAYSRLELYERAESTLTTLAARQPGDAAVLLNLGRVAARAGHYDRALHALEAVLKARPDDVECLLELGRLHAARREYSRAVYLLAQARLKAPKRPDILITLARAAEDAGYYGDSAIAYDEYLSVEPADDVAKRDRARVYGYTGKRLQEGLRELDQHLRRHPTDAIAHLYLGQLLWSKDSAKALEHFSTALQIQADYAPALHARGWLLYRLGRIAESLPDLERAAKLMPNEVRVLDELGLAYLTQERLTEAEAVLRRASELAPADPDVLMHLGRTLMSLNKEGEAQPYLYQFRQLRPTRPRRPLKDAGMLELATLSKSALIQRETERLRSMVQAHSDDPDLRLSLAKLLLSEGQVDKAAESFRALQAMNFDGRIWAEAGRALLAAQEYQLARGFLERAAERNPEVRLDWALSIFYTSGAQAALLALPESGSETGEELLLKARLLHETGNRREAEKVLHDGLERGNPNPPVALQASTLLLRYGRGTDALKLLDKTLEFHPGDPDLLLARALGLAMTGQHSVAAEALINLQSRWPEWDRPYIAHALLLEQSGKLREAHQRIRIALALGSSDAAVKCAELRLTGTSPARPPCACSNNFQEWVLGAGC